MTNEQAYAKFAGLLREIAKEYLRPGLDIDDLLQEASIGLMKATEQWEAEAGAAFISIARHRIRDAIRAFITRERARGMSDFPSYRNPDAPEIGFAPFDEVTEPESNSETPEEAYARHENISAIRQALASLPSETRDLLSEWASPLADARGNTRAMARTKGMCLDTLQRRVVSAQRVLKRVVLS